MLHNTNVRPTQANLILLNCISISLFHYSLLDLIITLCFLRATKTESATAKAGVNQLAVFTQKHRHLRL